jgi:hypothetical protein
MEKGAIRSRHDIGVWAPTDGMPCRLTHSAGSCCFPTFLIAPVIWISRNYRDHLAWVVSSYHLNRVALLAVSRFELAPVQLLPYCGPLDLAVTFIL